MIGPSRSGYYWYGKAGRDGTGGFIAQPAPQYGHNPWCHLCTFCKYLFASLLLLFMVIIISQPLSSLLKYQLGHFSGATLDPSIWAVIVLLKIRGTLSKAFSFLSFVFVQNFYPPTRFANRISHNVNQIITRTKTGFVFGVFFVSLTISSHGF